jgi:hypothetical protein
MELKAKITEVNLKFLEYWKAMKKNGLRLIIA